MPAYNCPNCHHLLHFETRVCPSCSHALGFDYFTNDFYHLDGASGEWRNRTGQTGAFGPCANARYGVCNWLVLRDDPQPLCKSCRHNRTIPDLAVAGVLERWIKLEDAKRRAIFGLMRLGLPFETWAERPGGLGFDLLYDPSAEQGGSPEHLTGHDNGIITINLLEADDAARERIRTQMGEPYRTLVGHFRHEIGHYFWDRLVDNSADLVPFRNLFGDERADYGQALQNHYNNPPPPGWEEHYVSTYATAHPWEDFAETFAHHSHIVDTLSVIGDFGVRMSPPPIAPSGSSDTAIDFDPYTADTATLTAHWIHYAFALNSINRSMGQPDLYPFKLSPGVVLKLDFINRLIAFAARRWAPGDNESSDLKALVATLGQGVELGSG
ncbi:zinc-binding metallopeptidase family protein [Sphingomonas immobilis]|nr:putative zinc-binding metallopeptidase [Sphingomonas sp. CA1-15]